MRKLLFSTTLLVVSFFGFAQQGNFWNRTIPDASKTVNDDKKSIKNPKVFELNLQGLKTLLKDAPKEIAPGEKSELIVSFPNHEGKFEEFKVQESSNFHPVLQEKYPEIRSYIGQSLDDPTNTIYFSISPLGLSSMEILGNRSGVFIEPYTKDLSSYVVYKKSEKQEAFNKIECTVVDAVQNNINDISSRPNADDGFMRTFRLALSVTAEYTQYFGGTKTLALAAMNNTMSRVNGVFEKDLAIKLILIQNNDVLIYTDPNTDPYSPTTSLSNWNTELQNNLTSVIGEANYDIGHLFGSTGSGGNAGCIGCVCNSGKGSAYTSPKDGKPFGDTFDIDYVIHEFGHQLGGNHTFSHKNEGSGVNMEPGSGSTIMAYAGITAQDVQPNSDALFHAISIQQITNNLKTKTCPTKTATGNAIPTANAGSDYTIPKGTPFMLTGAGTDADGDALTFIWEQMDNASTAQTAASSAASTTKTSGPTFRSWDVSTSPVRYFPIMSSVLAGSTTTQGTEILVEAVPDVARTLNFRFTVRDNRVGGSANNSDDMVVSVNGTAGPFSITSQNSAITYDGGTSQTITWNVAGTTANGVNTANVDILWSTNDGNTWTSLVNATPNDGSQAVTIPNFATTKGRIMVKGNNHIFFDVNNANITVNPVNPDLQAPTSPTNLTASGTTQTTTNLSWTASTDNVGVTGYDVYQGTTLIGSTTTATSFNVTGLSPSTTYTFTVKAKDATGNISASSNSVNVTTLAPIVDTTAPTAPTLTFSGTTSNSTVLSWSGATDNVGVTAYDVYQGTTLLASVVGTTYTITGLNPSTTYTFSVRAKDAAGNISSSSNVVSVTTLAPVLNYCTSTSNNTNDERIGNVKIGTINNTSTGAAGYEDFTAISTDLIKGNSVTITITPTWTSTVYPEGYGVFIDYNADGDFADAGETVWTLAATSTTPVSGTFTVPANTTNGSKRMRISLKYNGIPTSCETLTYGQVEDYTVVIKDAPDTTAPTAPTLSASGTTTNSTNLSWSGATDNFGVTGYEVYQGTTLITSTTSTSYTVSGLTPSTTYTFTVKAKDLAGNLSVSSNTVLVTTLAPADTTAPTAPTLSASGTTTNSTNLSWSGATDNVGVTGYDVYQGTTLITSTSSTSFNVTGLTPSTTYTFTVRAKDLAGNISVSSNGVSVTTLAIPSVNYCSVAASNTNDERIQNVKFGTIDNSSTGTSGYENFTSISTNVSRGTAYTISITPYWRATKYNEAYAVFIDLNADGDFSDAGEKVWTRNGTQLSPVTGSISIPTTATIGLTRMRVMMKYGTAPTSACTSYTFGQIEDYSINIQTSGKPVEDKEIDLFNLYPNPVKDGNLFVMNPKSLDYEIYDMSGKLINIGKISDGKVNVSNLPNGVYIIRIGNKTKRFIKE